ncbi:hypothetical protein V1291_005281 [Nitrobacteraceae bacterium AZCC 1564]
MSVHTSLHIDESAKGFTFKRSQDVEDIIEANKQAAALPQASDWGRHVARIPNIFLEQWLNEEYARGNVSLRLFTPEFDRLIARKLQDPDWRFLRVDAASTQAGWRGGSS